MSKKESKQTYLRKLKIKLVKSKYENRIKEQLRFPEQVCDIFWDLKDEAVETMIGVYLNNELTEGRHIVLNVGTQSTLLVATNEVLDLAIANKMPYIILIHNHPSGKIEPSDADREFIKKMRVAADATARTLLDFIIVGTPRDPKKKIYWSMFEESDGGEYGLGALD